MAEFQDDVTAKYADRIAKLLAKAESTNHPEEADSLFAKAQELMTEHNITAAMIAQAGGGAGTDVLADGELWFTGIYQNVTMEMAFTVAHYNNVKCVYQTGRELAGKKAIKVMMFGFKSDITNVEMLVNSLQLQSAQAMQRWAKTDPIFALASTPMEKFKEKREFIIGFRVAIGKRLRDAEIAGRKAAADAAAARGVENAASSVALVVQSKSQLVEEGFHKKFSRLGKGRGGVTSHGSSSSNMAGQSAGAKASMGGGKSVSGGGKAIGR